jgi:hypothetical protein
VETWLDGSTLIVRISRPMWLDISERTRRAADRKSGGWEGHAKRVAVEPDRPHTARDHRKGGLAMRYLAVALALAFAVGTMSVAQACPDLMKTASTQVASTNGQTAPSTKVRIPTPPEG